MALDDSTTGGQLEEQNFGGVRYRMRSYHEILMVGSGLSHVESTNRAEISSHKWRKVETPTYMYTSTI